MGGNTRLYLQEGADVGIGDRRTARGVLSSASHLNNREAAGDFNGGHLVVQSDDAWSGNNLGIVSLIQEGEHGMRAIGVKEPNRRSEAAECIPGHAAIALEYVQDATLTGTGRGGFAGARNGGVRIRDGGGGAGMTSEGWSRSRFSVA